jgi:hypothetical protein
VAHHLLYKHLKTNPPSKKGQWCHLHTYREEMRQHIIAAMASIQSDTLKKIWAEFNYQLICVVWHTEGVPTNRSQLVSFSNNWWISHHQRNTGYCRVNILNCYLLFELPHTYRKLLTMLTFTDHASLHSDTCKVQKYENKYPKLQFSNQHHN